MVCKVTLVRRVVFCLNELDVGLVELVQDCSPSKTFGTEPPGVWRVKTASVAQTRADPVYRVSPLTKSNTHTHAHTARARDAADRWQAVTAMMEGTNDAIRKGVRQYRFHAQQARAASLRLCLPPGSTAVCFRCAVVYKRKQRDRALYGGVGPTNA